LLSLLEADKQSAMGCEYFLPTSLLLAPVHFYGFQNLEPLPAINELSLFVKSSLL
jgi:hypothetical protein